MPESINRLAIAHPSSLPSERPRRGSRTAREETCAAKATKATKDAAAVSPTAPSRLGLISAAVACPGARTQSPSCKVRFQIHVKDVCSYRAGRPGSRRVVGRGSPISPRVVSRGARVGDPPRPCQPWSRSIGSAKTQSGIRVTNSEKTALRPPGRSRRASGPARRASPGGPSRACQRRRPAWRRGSDPSRAGPSPIPQRPTLPLPFGNKVSIQ